MGFNIASIFSTGASELVKSVSSLIDGVTTTKEEKAILNLDLQKVILEHEEKMVQMASDELKNYLLDVQNAREVNVKIQDSKNASWLSKNVLYILALFITIGFFSLLSYMLLREVPAGNKDVLNILLGSLGTAWITIIGYFFGSSAGSKTNADSIRKIAENK